MNVEKEAIVPFAEAMQCNANGGMVIAGTTPEGAQHMRLTYEGVQVGGRGSLVGPGAAPSVAPTLAAVGGAGLSTGAYQYAYTDVTPSGESLPSPLGTVTTGPLIPNPTDFPNTATYDGAGNIFGDGPRDWAYTWLDSAGGETAPSPRVTRTVVNPIALAFTHPLPVGPLGTAARRLYRTQLGSSTLQLVATINDNMTTSYRDAISDGSLGATAPTSNTSTLNKVHISAIGIGPSPTTQRKLYRTVVAGAQLKLLTTIADNVTMTYADSTPDGSLGANAPTSDTSGLTQPSGQVLAGSTTMPVANPAAFYPSTGGWAHVGENYFRYHNVSGNSLINIPAEGPGSLALTIPYNAIVLASPALTGISPYVDPTLG